MLRFHLHKYPLNVHPSVIPGYLASSPEADTQERRGQVTLRRVSDELTLPTPC